MDPTRVHQIVEQVSQLLADRLGARGADLTVQFGAARQLPRRVRRAGAVLAEAQMMAASPKMARRLDPARIGRAHSVCVKYLRPIGAGARRGRRALEVIANAVLGLLLIAAVAFGLAYSRGLL